MKNKKIGIFAVAILSAVLIASVVLAFGVAIPYWDNPEWYPLKLAPGESKIISLTLQNTGEDDAIFRANLTSGSEIAVLVDENLDYSVPSGEVNKLVNIKVEIPENAELQARYRISVSFQQISLGEGGMVSLASGLTASFPVEIVGYEESVKRAEIQKTPPQEEKNYMWVITLAILIAIVIAVIVVKKYQKAKPQRSSKVTPKV
ncbi:MAG: hypothetical protein AABW50_01960 [Nanoarchaeota archaeon]